MIRPVLFNTDMVRAILDGRKTETRRKIKFPSNRFTGEIPKADSVKVYKNTLLSDKISFHENPHYVFDMKPPCKRGDVLYIRETWQYLYELDRNEEIIEGTGRYYYAATDTIPFGAYVDSEGASHEKIPWRPSIHMPKAATRIWLKVTGVKVERLQDIDDDGVVAEGLQIGDPFDELWDSTIEKRIVTVTDGKPTHGYG